MTKSKENALKLYVSLPEISPMPWREIEVPLNCTLEGLHYSIQAAFLWDDKHLWEFLVSREKRYGPDFSVEEDRSVRPAKAATLQQLVQEGVTELTYIYDFGDFWVHRIELKEAFCSDDITSLPLYVGGEYAAPPEDVGGVPGYEYFVNEVFNNLKSTERENYKHMLNSPHFGKFDPHDPKARMIIDLMAEAQEAAS